MMAHHNRFDPQPSLHHHLGKGVRGKPETVIGVDLLDLAARKAIIAWGERIWHGDHDFLGMAGPDLFYAA